MDDGVVGVPEWVKPGSTQYFRATLPPQLSGLGIGGTGFPADNRPGLRVALLALQPVRREKRPANQRHRALAVFAADQALRLLDRLEDHRELRPVGAEPEGAPPAAGSATPARAEILRRRIVRERQADQLEGNGAIARSPAQRRPCLPPDLVDRTFDESLLAGCELKRLANGQHALATEQTAMINVLHASYPLVPCSRGGEIWVDRSHASSSENRSRGQRVPAA